MILKKTLLNLCGVAILSIFTTQLNAQVTIGSSEKPVQGALLDLKENTPTSQGITSTKGMGTPRVAITKIVPATPDELSASIGNTGSWDMDAHIGLLVFNTNEDQCLDNPVHKGLYVWDGAKWNSLGKQSVSPDVYEVTDVRDNEVYLAGKFGTAGDWLLENVRYYNSNFALVGGTSSDNQFYAYPKGKAENTFGNPPATWNKNQGLLYSYNAATMGAQYSINNQKQGQGQINQGPTVFIQGVCPAGWHVPSDKEWNDLEEELYNHPEKYSSYSGSSEFDVTPWDPNWDIINNGNLKLNENNVRGSNNGKGHSHAATLACKILNSAHSTAGTGLAVRENGFGVLNCGYSYYGGATADDFGWSAHFWTSSKNDDQAILRRLYYTLDGVARYSAYTGYGYSVRCKFTIFD